MAEPPPPLRAWASKGASGGCGGCNYIQLNVQNFPAGNYTLSCLSGGSLIVGTTPQVYSVPANGSVQLNCYFGYPGESVSVGISGRANSDPVTW